MAEGTLDLASELEEFRALKGDAAIRNQDFWLLRQAFQGIFRWPSDWPSFKPKLRVPMIRKMVLVHAALLMGKGFTTDVMPLGEKAGDREKTQRPELALDHTYGTGAGRQHLNRAAVLGSLLGTSGFKTFQDETNQGPVAAFHAIQPELFFPITRGDDYMNLSKVFYGYSIDRLTAERTYKKPADSFRSEQEVEEQFRGPKLTGARLGITRGGADTGNYIVTGNYAGAVAQEVAQRRIPVMEVWTDDNYALWVGGEQIENGSNPYDFIPFTAIPNIDGGFGVFGESDVDQILELNEELNQLVSNMSYIEKRYMNPTYWWRIPPENYVDLATRISGGGGIIPLFGRSELGLLEIPQFPPNYSELLDRLRSFSIELSGLSELSFSGEAGGSINTGASLTVNFTNVLATLGLKQSNWSVGLQRLSSQMLYHLEQMKEIGVVPDASVKSVAGGQSGMLKLTGKDIGGHRRVAISWPGVLPKDDIGQAQLVIQEVQAGLKARVTAMEELGVRYPEDELAVVQEEQQNPAINPEGTSTVMRAQTDQARQQAEASGQQAPPDQSTVPDQQDLSNLTETPPGFGTLPSGQVADAGGRVLDQNEADLVRFQARQQRGAQGAPEAQEGGPPIA